MAYHLLFEQSGTFKKCFKNLGFSAFDYDIENQFNETDYQLDLFKEIENCYNGLNSIFDSFTSDDLLIAFFPCIRFENQIIMHFKGTVNKSSRTLIEKLNYDLKLHDELNLYYSIITKLVIICINRNLKLIIENPYSTQHYLVRYWCLEATVIDHDRTLHGDYFVKPTQYYFINCEPKYNIIFDDYYSLNEVKTINQMPKGIERSLISSDYVLWFIKTFII